MNDDAVAYLKRARHVQAVRFGRTGVAHEDSLVTSSRTNGTLEGGAAPKVVEAITEDPTGGTGEGIVLVHLNSPLREVRQLPMKKSRPKRSRSSSDDEVKADTPCVWDGVVSSAAAATVTGAPLTNCRPGEEEAEVAAAPLELTQIASPTAPLPQVEGVTQRISLMAKWFPAALQERKVDVGVAPSATFVEATVERMSKLRDYVLSLRYGMEDLEALLLGTQKTHPEIWSGSHSAATGGKDESRRDFLEYWNLSRGDVRSLVQAVGTASFAESLAEFGMNAPTSRSAVTTAVGKVLCRRRRVHTPIGYRIKAWHEYLDGYGPEAGRAPRLSDILWLTPVSATALFTVATNRVLRGARVLAESQQLVEADQVSDSDSGGASEAEARISDGPRFFDNTEAASAQGEPLSASASSARAWLLSAQIPFDSSLSAEQRATLSFLRFVLPTAHTERAKISTGYGVWLFAIFGALDLPLDPDADRLAHELFRTCCRHLRTLGNWKGIVSSSPRDSLLRTLSSRNSEAALPVYASLEEVRREDVLFLYTIVVVLSRFFRQNQDHFMPF